MKRLSTGILALALCLCFLCVAPAWAGASTESNGPTIVLSGATAEPLPEPDDEEETVLSDSLDMQDFLDLSEPNAEDDAENGAGAGDDEAALPGEATQGNDNGIPEVRWTYAVSLTAIQSKYALLVNADNMLTNEFEPSPLVKVTGVKRATSAAVYLEQTAAEALQDMFNAAKQVTEFTYVTESGREKVAEYNTDTGMVLYLKSGYRSYGTQSTTYANYLARNNNVDDGYVAKPGASEHQTGICADILNDDYAGRPTMTQDFKWTPEAQWMKANCADFGFILRFTEDKEDVTGIKFEPWHFRYVGGEDVAWYIMNNNLTLEEFTSEASAAMTDFLARGGNLEEQLEFEYRRLNAPPESYVLDELGIDGDAEVSLLL